MTPPPYTLSFTVGGLFLFEGIQLARLHASWDEVRRTAPNGVFVAKGSASSVKRIRNELVGSLAQGCIKFLTELEALIRVEEPLPAHDPKDMTPWMKAGQTDFSFIKK
ncbi:hypothetical protein ACEN2J_20565 [Pseudorhodobacter sp. W20_MBD10_FR17]|uniref:hypothetical protein n=1 Tax=Pseudorhodobacter sp. W20_MBD10_FR17 TaxID=3240266 RepID=UPI003F9E6007